MSGAASIRAGFRLEGRVAIVIGGGNGMAPTMAI